MTLKEMMRVRDCVAAMLAVLDPLGAMFAVHYKTWSAMDEAIQRKIMEAAGA